MFEAAATLSRIEDEERELVFPRFDLEDAWILGSALR